MKSTYRQIGKGKGQKGMMKTGKVKVVVITNHHRMKTIKVVALIEMKNDQMNKGPHQSTKMTISNQGSNLMVALTKKKKMYTLEIVGKTKKKENERRERKGNRMVIAQTLVSLMMVLSLNLSMQIHIIQPTSTVKMMIRNIKLMINSGKVIQNLT